VEEMEKMETKIRATKTFVKELKKLLYEIYNDPFLVTPRRIEHIIYTILREYSDVGDKKDCPLQYKNWGK